MQSKFFAEGGASDSNDSDDNVSQTSEQEEKVVKKPAYFESSSDEDVKRVVRSEKDKRYEALRQVISRIKDKMRIKDFVSLSDEFDELNKQLEKSKKVIEKEGVPLFYIRICYVLENFCNNIPADEKKALKPANAKAYNTLKHKIKKNNKAYEQKIKEFGENPIYSDEEENEEVEEKNEKTKKKAKASDDEDDEWPDTSDEDEDEEEEEDIKKYLQSSDPQVRRNYWLKRPEKEKPAGKDVEKKPKPVRAVKTPAVKDYEDKFDTKTKKTEIYTLEEMDKRIKEIVERRSGRKINVKEKKVSIEDDLEALQGFFDKCKGDDIKRLEVLLILMPTRLEFSRQFSQYYMPRQYWLENFENMVEFFKIIKNRYGKLDQVRTFQKDGDNYYKESAIIESFSTHFDGLDNELWKAFKSIENSSMEYSERLRDHADMIKLCNDAVNFFRSTGDDVHETKFAYKKIEYTYYMSDKLFEKLRASASERSLETKNEFYTETNSQNTIHELATKIYKSNDTKLIVKTMLYQIYNHAINGRYHIAKDYLLMSHIPDMAPNLDINTQITYNRVLVQLGMCAFSLGLIQECVNALTDIVSSGRIKELLGQGISKNSTNEKEERRRMLPYHMHINVEVAEAVHLIASMLIEIPNIVAESIDASKKQSAKFFRKQYEQYRNFYGPPESFKDYIIVAAKELHQGNWKKCYEYLLSVNIWNKLSQDVKSAQENLLAKVKEQAFKCYVFTFKNCYQAIDIDKLAVKFDITKDYIHSFVSKMVFNNELRAHLDVDSNCLMFETDNLNRIESLCLSLADKVSNTLANNEKIMDSKYGNYGFSDKDISEGIVKKRATTKKNLNIFNKDKRKGKGKKI